MSTKRTWIVTRGVYSRPISSWFAPLSSQSTQICNFRLTFISIEPDKNTPADRERYPLFGSFTAAGSSKTRRPTPRRVRQARLRDETPRQSPHTRRQPTHTRLKSQLPFDRPWYRPFDATPSFATTNEYTTARTPFSEVRRGVHRQRQSF